MNSRCEVKKPYNMVHISVKTNDRIKHEEKTINWKPLPRELNYSPFQCPQLALIEKLFGYYGQQQKSSKKNKGQRDMFVKVGNEIRNSFRFFKRVELLRVVGVDGSKLKKDIVKL